MDIAPEVIRAESHVEIGALLQRDAHVIVNRWCDVARDEQATARRVHHVVLGDELPAFLNLMGRALKQAGRPESDAQQKAAKEHGEQRWENGWSLSELVRDYQLLRLVVLEYLEENLGRPLYYREGMAVGVFIDDAIAASISRYVAHRDQQVQSAERERAQTLEELNRRKDEFLAILGHELRNPLAPIRNSIAVIRKVLDKPHRAIATSLDVLDRQSQQLGRLVDDLLDLARIGRGEFELRKARIDLRTAIDQALQMTESLISVRHQRLDVSIPATPLFLEADPNRITQIVANLLNNAAKYTEPAGTIGLTVDTEDSTAVVRVRDNGIGIAADMLSHVFELFARVEHAAEPVGREGLGIGLALVQRLVQQHGGTISAHSAGIGHGAEFVVRLPLNSAPGGTPEPDPDSGQILVIRQISKDSH